MMLILADQVGPTGGAGFIAPAWRLSFKIVLIFFTICPLIYLSCARFLQTIALSDIISLPPEGNRVPPVFLDQNRDQHRDFAFLINTINRAEEVTNGPSTILTA